MPDISISGEFLGSDGPERAKKCRQLAAEAEALATSANNPSMRESYLDLAQQWTKLADEIEQAVD